MIDDDRGRTDNTFRLEPSTGSPSKNVGLFSIFQLPPMEMLSQLKTQSKLLNHTADCEGLKKK